MRHTFRAERYASSSRPGDADSQTAVELTSARNVSTQRQCTPAPDVEKLDSNSQVPHKTIHTDSIKSPLNLDAWAHGLLDHPNPTFAASLLNGIVHGVDIGYTGPNTLRVHTNWPSVEEHRAQVEAIISQDIEQGRVLGPFSAPPTDHFVGNPMGAIKKRSTDKVRLIHDLSWPPQHSVNDYISQNEYTLQYLKFDEIVSFVKSQGLNCYIAKLDLASAFKHILVKKDQWKYLGFTMADKCMDGSKKLRFYLSTCLAFGLRSSPKLFDMYAQGLEYIFYKNGVSHVYHYLDDNFTISSDYSTCKNNISIMVNVCNELGFEIQPKKLVYPSQCVEVLGIVIDTKLMQLRISGERLKCINEELLLWSGKKSCTKRQLLSLIGKLQFICKVVRHGRTFVRRLIHLSKKLKHLHHKIRLTVSAQKDVNWWLYFMHNFHGIGLFYEQEWIHSDKMHLWTDASDHGYGCVFENQYIYEKFDNGLTKRPIAWRELYAIVVAAATWGHHLARKRIIFNCDNEAIVYCIKSGVSKDSELMTLLRKLFFICDYYSFECSAVYLTSKSNVLADALSRGDMNKFLLNCSEKMYFCNATDILCDIHIYR